MHKTKRGPALFEVLSEDSQSAAEMLQVPVWHDRSDEVETRAAIALSTKIRPERAQAVERPREETPPFADLVGGRLRVSFSSMTAAVTVFVLLSILLAAFELGSRAGFTDGQRVGYAEGRVSFAAEAVSEIELARSQPPATHLVAGLLASAGEASTAADTPGARGDVGSDPVWIPGYTYIVAQEFTPDRAEDVGNAQAFLAQNGISTVAVNLPGGAIQLITTGGYNHKDPTQKRVAEQLLEEVRKVGSRYYATGGGYRLDGYFKLLKNSNW